MDELTPRQRIALETIMMAVGLLACFLFWWHDGNLYTPSYILFVMMTGVGFVGFALRFYRCANQFSGWCAVAAVAVAPASMVLALVGISGIMQRTTWASAIPTYFVLVAYGLVTVGTEMSRRAEKRHRPQARR